MNFERVIAAVLQNPWAIVPERLSAIASVLARRESGERYTAEQIAAAIGERKASREPYSVAAGCSCPCDPCQSGDCGECSHEDCDCDGCMCGSAMGATKASISAHSPHVVTASGMSPKTGPRKMIAVLPVYGIIGPKASQFEDVSGGGGGCGIDQLTSRFRQALANPDISAIVMDFDSPGGSVYGVDELASEIFAARRQKKIVAQVNPMCASAAYYLASQCGEIVMMPSAQAGSIGVFTMHADMSKAMEMQGVKLTHISAGKYKVDGNSQEPLSDSAREDLQASVDTYYGMFVAAVARGREVKAADVRNGFGQGRVVRAVEAKKIGMVDRIATLDETLSRLGGNTAQSQSLPAAAQHLPLHSAEQISPIHTTAVAEQQEVVDMAAGTAALAVTASIEQIRAASLAESERCEAIMGLAKQHGVIAKTTAWINGGTSVQAVQSEILASLQSTVRPIATAAAEASDIRVTLDAADKTPGSIRIARMVRCLAFAGQKRGGTQMAIDHANRMGDPVVARAFEMATVQNASSVTSGGAVVPENFVPDLIEFLRPVAVFRSMNPASYPLVNGNITIPKLSMGGMAAYVGELSPIPASKAQTSSIKGAAKKLAALIPVGNDLARYAGLSVDAALRDDMVLALAQAEDVAFIRGEGSVYSPRGLRYQAAAGAILPSPLTKALITANTAQQTLLAVLADFGTLELYLANNNVKFRRPGILMSRRTENFLKFRVVDGYGNTIFRKEMESGKFLGYPYKATSVIPNNLGVSGYDSEVYLADFADVVICDAPTINIEVSYEASYVDGDGVTHNAFQDDVMLVRVIEEHDLIIRHQESIAVLTAVQYGA